MAGKKILLRLPLFLALLALLGGCNGVLYEKQHESGHVDRVRLAGGESWSEFDTTPRYRSQKSKDGDGYGIMLKNEAIF